MARNTSVTLGEHFDHFVAERVKQGRYQSVSEVVRAGLRLLEEDEIKLAQLRRKLEAAELSPVIDNFDEQRFVAELQQKYGK
ncbi:type II toxin-antitoxin system ParD family antitoxin [Rheinheimera sp. EpRS3]|uniref:type II toxin-antitoxin system ParD family antitoxin n=1 Tax=Rheinheimera sp. EpRS3 TaxID=1712383 RepID=UPI00074AAE49|nr:type II toxin-antitoxin system ParD family antitoxin [Rheinheimera sp. EpRS3]KUM54767.1 antitoxin [Rheinheimera sp. EpRS3]